MSQEAFWATERPPTTAVRAVRGVRRFDSKASAERWALRNAPLPGDYRGLSAHPRPKPLDCGGWGLLYDGIVGNATAKLWLMESGKLEKKR